ncbi:hypothetical acyltransferase family protein [Photobacterium profundum 3TCK]|nr:hypothetical acyltransferase family protein [Photobacterium profundum 3TCK]
MPVDSESPLGREPEQTAQSVLNVIKELVKELRQGQEPP